MRHARPDYDRFQDPLGKIPEDEPVFLIRGQDKSAPATLRYWALQNEKNGGDPELTKTTLEHARLMLEWQRQQGCKPADLRHRCPQTCPHGDRCTLEAGHEGGCNHRGCDCNEPDSPSRATEHHIDPAGKVAGKITRDPETRTYNRTEE